jgi:hypothetical protein
VSSNIITTTYCANEWKEYIKAIVQGIAHVQKSVGIHRHELVSFVMFYLWTYLSDCFLNLPPGYLCFQALRTTQDIIDKLLGVKGLTYPLVSKDK